MEADDLLRQIGQRARAEGGEPEEADAVWERLARGELSAAEDAALRARAEADPEIASLYEAYRPLAPAVREKIAGDAVAALSPHVRVGPWRRIALVAAPLAAAAAVALLLMRPPAGSGGDARLPSYSLAFTGGDRAVRSGDPGADDPTVLRRASRLEIVLRPATSVPGAIAVHAFLVQGADAREWNVPMDRSTDGAVRIAGEAGALLGVSAGSWDLAFTVGPGGTATPEPAEVARATRGEGGAHAWQLLERRVQLIDGP